MDALTEKTYRYTVPLLLVVVALTQNVLVRDHGLTQWKGGGFGMFSTVDSRATRYVRWFLITKDNHEIPVQPPDRMARTRESIRSLPTREKMRHYRNQLLAEPWIAKNECKNDSSMSNGPASSGMEKSAREKHSQHRKESVLFDTCDGYRTKKSYRLKRPNEQVADGEHAIVPVAIRAEFWSYDFDQENMQLTSKKVFQVRRQH
jgi:hypothetical protein